VVQYSAEFLGAFFLVLTIGLTALSSAPTVPLAIGAVLMVFIYALGPLSALRAKRLRTKSHKDWPA
jgi:aquaporin Z